jgi:hypothetical protein
MPALIGPNTILSPRKIVGILFVFSALVARGEIIHQTAEPGIAGEKSGSGLSLSSEFYAASNFQVLQTVETGSIGGHLKDFESEGDIFGAIVRTTGPTDRISPSDLEGEDLLGATRILLPYPSDHVGGNLRVTLEPGWYAVVFGSGRFGADGEGGALLGNPHDETSNVYTIRTSDGSSSLFEPGIRFFVDSAPVPTLTAIYETGQLVGLPNPQGIYTRFGDPSSDGDDLCFYAEDSSFFDGRAIYKRVGDELSVVARYGTPVPEASSDLFDSFGVGQCAIDEGAVVFVGKGSNLVEGIYTDFGGVLRRVIDSTMQIPGGTGTFQPDLQTWPSMEGGRVTFLGRSGTGSAGVFVWENGETEVLANRTTLIPGRTTLFGIFDAFAPIEAGVIAFSGASVEGPLAVPPAGLYRTTGDELEAVFESGIPMPGGGANLGVIFFTRMRSGRFAFAAYDETRALGGVFTDASGELRSFLRTDSNLPGTSVLVSGFGAHSFDGRHVCVVAYGRNVPTGLYADHGGAPAKVVRTNDRILGRTVSSVSLGPPASERNRIIFRISFTDQSQAILEARYPPPPGDVDNDGDGDLHDLGRLQNCFGGSFQPPAHLDCSAADFNGDTDVDLDDYRAWVTCANGASTDSLCSK